MTTNDELSSDRSTTNLKPPTNEAGAGGRFNPLEHESRTWTLPAYLSEAEHEEVPGLHPTLPIVWAEASLPGMTITLPVDAEGHQIADDEEYYIRAHKEQTPYADNVTLAELQKRKISVTLSYRVHGWTYGWPEHMSPKSKPGADLASPTKNQSVPQ